MLYLPWRLSDDHHDDHDDETFSSAATARSFVDGVVTDCVVTGGNRDEALVEGWVGVLSTLAIVQDRPSRALTDRREWHRQGVNHVASSVVSNPAIRYSILC
jgi:hypothetical protein